MNNAPYYWLIVTCGFPSQRACNAESLSQNHPDSLLIHQLPNFRHIFNVSFDISDFRWELIDGTTLFKWLAISCEDISHQKDWLSHQRLSVLHRTAKCLRCHGVCISWPANAFENELSMSRTSHNSTSWIPHTTVLANLDRSKTSAWWLHQMVLALCAGNSPATGEFPAKRSVTRSFDVFFDVFLNKRLN